MMADIEKEYAPEVAQAEINEATAAEDHANDLAMTPIADEEKPLGTEDPKPLVHRSGPSVKDTWKIPARLVELNSNSRVDDLKARLKQLGYGTSGAKGELCERVVRAEAETELKIRGEEWWLKRQVKNDEESRS